MKSVTRPLVLGVLLSLALAACGGSAFGSPSPSSPAATDPPPTEVPGGLDGSGGPDDGVVGGGGGVNPGGAGGQPGLSVPKPGTTIDPHPISIETLEEQIDGRKVVILATWTSGVEPCHVLDTVAVKQDGNAFTVALTEGTGDPNAMCIEMAQQHATAIDLGELEPGEYTVEAQDGPAQPISFTVS